MFSVHAQLGINKKAGYTMLFAVLVSTVLLSIGIFILNVSKKEVILSAIGRESAMAFYAADGGVECAHYWNAQTSDAGLRDPFGLTAEGVVKTGISLSCGSRTIPVNSVRTALSANSVQNVSNFLNGVSNSSDQCSDVTVKKIYRIDQVSSTSGTPPVTTISDVYTLLSTTIESRGYNTCVTSDPRRVERGLRETIQ